MSFSSGDPFGNGNLLFTAQEYGFNPVGIDLRKANVNSLKQIGIEAYCEPVENINFEKNFSVISMMDVLEHMPYPKVVLKKLSTKFLLKQKKMGVLLFQCLTQKLYFGG